MVPLDGTIAAHVPDIVATVDRLVPAEGWAQLTVADLTAGSCLMPLAFGARGPRRMIVNDPAPRSAIGARALFGGTTLDKSLLPDLLTAPVASLRAHVPSFHFACDYLTEDVAAIFDRLFHAELPEDQRRVCQYLALLWVCGFAPTAEDGFEVLMTHDVAQLAALKDHNWRPYLERARHAPRVLDALADQINAAIRLQCAGETQILSADLLDVVAAESFEAPCLAVINPPTNGLDEYVVDDQLLHSLIVNRWVPLSMSRESKEDFWRRRVTAGLEALPMDALAIVWGGDGALNWDECFATWTGYGSAAHVRRAGPGDAAPGWAIIRRG
jgi:hypothetical protein